MADHAHRAEHVVLELSQPVLYLQTEERGVDPGRIPSTAAGVVEQDVHPAEAGIDGGCHLPGGGLVGQVTDRDHGRAAAGVDLGSDALGPLPVAPVDGDRDTLLGKELCRSFPDSRGAAGDQGSFARQLEIHSDILPLNGPTAQTAVLEGPAGAQCPVQQPLGMRLTVVCSKSGKEENPTILRIYIMI